MTEEDDSWICPRTNWELKMANRKKPTVNSHSDEESDDAKSHDDDDEETEDEDISGEKLSSPSLSPNGKGRKVYKDYQALLKEIAGTKVFCGKKHGIVQQGERDYLIVCSCRAPDCKIRYPPSSFVIHAGSTRKRPWQYIKTEGTQQSLTQLLLAFRQKQSVKNVIDYSFDDSWLQKRPKEGEDEDMFK